MRADAKVTWGQPQMMAEEFGMTTYEIDGRPKGRFAGNAVALEEEGIRQFTSELEEGGVRELTIFAHSIGATKALDLVVAMEQKNPNLRVNVVLINPAGLYPQNFWTIAKNYIREGSVENRIKNPDRVFQPHKQVLIDIATSIFKDIKQAGPGILKLWRDQKNALSQLNANLARIKSPVMIMVATEDPVFPPEGIFPQQEVDKRLEPTSSDEELNSWLDKQVKWEDLPADMQAKYGSEEAFKQHNIGIYRRYEEMNRVRKAREQYLKENVLPNAADIKVIVATKYANHIAFGVERPRPSSHIIARYFDRVRGASERKVSTTRV